MGNYRVDRWLGFGIWALLLLTAISFRAEAAEPPRSATTADAPGGTRLELALGVSQGLATLSPSAALQEEAAGAGTQLELVTSLSLRLSRIVLEAGAGWFSSQLSSDSRDQALSRYELGTRGALAQLSTLYQVTDRLRVGPLAELLFGSDMSFEPGFGDPSKDRAWLAGAELLYGFKVFSNELRAGARYLTSLSLQDRSLQAFQATVQFGIPLLDR